MCRASPDFFELCHFWKKYELFLQKGLPCEIGMLICRALFGRPHRLARPRTPGFHPGDTGSNPVGDANFFRRRQVGGFFVSSQRDENP